MKPLFSNLSFLPASSEEGPFPLREWGPHKWPPFRRICVTFPSDNVEVVGAHLTVRGRKATVLEENVQGPPTFRLETFEKGWAELTSQTRTMQVLSGSSKVFWQRTGSEGVRLVKRSTPSAGGFNLVIQPSSNIGGISSLQRLVISKPEVGTRVLINRVNVVDGGSFTFDVRTEFCKLTLEDCDFHGVYILARHLTLDPNVIIHSGRIRARTLDAGDSRECSAHALRNVSVEATKVLFNSFWLEPLPNISCCAKPEGLVTLHRMFCVCGVQHAIHHEPLPPKEPML